MDFKYLMPILALSLLLSGCTLQGGPQNQAIQNSTQNQTNLSGIHKIQHVVIIMQENRAFDNYFGTFPGADGIPTYPNGSFSVCVPDPATGVCVVPYHDTADSNVGGPHDHPSAVVDIDGGNMDGFITQQEAAVKSTCNIAVNPTCLNGVNGSVLPDVMGYRDNREIPNYWTYAQDFVLQDRMFESAESWSLPSHLFLVSEWSAKCKSSDPMSCTSNLNQAGSPTFPAQMQKYPNGTMIPPDYAWTDLTYLLHASNVSWAYYLDQGYQPDCADSSDLSCNLGMQSTKVPEIWNPLPWFSDVRKDDQLGDIKTIDDFKIAAENGSLPSVVWIIPNSEDSEHPPALTSTGQTYTTNIINTLMQSPDWNSTAIFLTWDDWGGFYDNALPPAADQNGYGLRVPGIVISPYAKQGYIDNQTLSFDAYSKFIEDDFLNGQRLDPATDGRPDSRPDVRENSPLLGDLSQDFDFSQSPRPPVILNPNPSTDLVENNPKIKDSNG